MLNTQAVILQITFTEKKKLLLMKFQMKYQGWYYLFKLIFHLIRTKNRWLSITGKAETFKYFCSFETIWMNLAAYYYKEINYCRSLLEIAFTLAWVIGIMISVKMPRFSNIFWDMVIYYFTSYFIAESCKLFLLGFLGLKRIMSSLS